MGAISESKTWRCDLCSGYFEANDAYNAMYNNTFDLIVSDIMMPGIDGFEFAKTVRKLDEEIPILFMTARDDFASKQCGYRIGIDDYMVKPVDLDEFWDADSNSAPRAVDVYMTKLRDKFSKCEDFEIVTVYGLGYKAVIK